MAFFIRTRRLDLKRLDRKPQENLSVVHAILTASVNDLLQKIRALERKYYGVGKSDTDEIKKWSASVRNIMAVVNVGTIASSWQLEEIIKQTSDPNTQFSVDMFELNKLKECYRKIRDNVPSKFTDILIDAKVIIKYLEKYCLSFYDLDTDVVIETSQHYESKRLGFKTSIRDSLDRVTVMAEQFRVGKQGIGASDLSQYGLDLARKTNCTAIAFLLLFPECCASIKRACADMSSWIAADENYSVFLRNDVKDLGKEHDESLKLLRDLQPKLHQMTFRHKQMESELDKLSTDLNNLADKELELMIREEESSTETNDIQTEIEMKEYRRDELIKSAMNLHPSILYERYSELSELLRDLKRRLPYARREREALRHKLDWISNKKAERRQLQKKLEQVAEEMGQLDQRRQEQEVEHEHLNRRLELARQLHLYKSCSDSMEKIFHERPVEVNKSRLPGQRGPEDPFERTCVVTALYIENDWPRLYRTLPFHPPRGTSTIDKDVQELAQNNSRMTMTELATRCFYRWRRFHTRAKLEDIKVALGQIKRYDILHRIEHELNPVSEREPEQGEKITYVEEYLIPYVKQVERFDELRAANKL